MLLYLGYILLVSAFATTMMTLFSYALSALQNKQFREPQLINNLLNESSLFKFPGDKSSSTGWIIHYGIGLVFTVFYFLLYNANWFELGAISTFLFGMCTGILGILSWQTMFSSSENPPQIAFSAFYFQLLLAHLVFAISLTGGIYILGF